MTTLLHIDASPSVLTSISRALSAEFVRQWCSAHPHGQVLRRDLAEGNIPTLDAGWIEAAVMPAAQRNDAQRQRLVLSDTLTQELIDADEYVIGTPMYNFAAPAALKLWIDQIVRLGVTFGRNGSTRLGLLAGKKLTVFVASGGQYQADMPTAQLDFVSHYLKAIFSFIGVQDVSVHAADNVATLLQGQVSRAEFLQPHLDAIKLAPR